MEMKRGGISLRIEQATANKPREGRRKIIKRNPATRTGPSTSTSTSTRTQEARIQPREKQNKNKNPSNGSRRNRERGGWGLAERNPTAPNDGRRDGRAETPHPFPVRRSAYSPPPRPTRLDPPVAATALIARDTGEEGGAGEGRGGDEASDRSKEMGSGMAP